MRESSEGVRDRGSESLLKGLQRRGSMDTLHAQIEKCKKILVNPHSGPSDHLDPPHMKGFPHILVLLILWMFRAS